MNMKTNQVMKRDNIAFEQRTKDGYFNATRLIDTWNQVSGDKAVQLGNYKSSKSTTSFIDQLISEGIENPMVSGRGRGGGTWMHPKLFIDFAMYVSVTFKSKVLDYVLDGLIKSRHDAGDYYNEMCATALSVYIDCFGKKPNPSLYINEARLIKDALGLKSKKRNEMSEHELMSITQMQKFNSLLIIERVGKAKRIKQLELQAKLLKM